MRILRKLILILLKILNYWFFVIPSKFSILVLVGYNFGIYLYFGKWSIETVQQTLGYESLSYKLFLLFIVFPMFWAFICCQTAAKMASGNTKVTSAIDNAIAYRNGQMNLKSPQKAFEIYKDTSHLDLIRENKDKRAFEKALQGFNAKHGNKPSNQIFNELIKK